MAEPWKSWQVNRYPRRADVCDINMSQGLLQDSTLFISGHHQPPAHPRCRCTLILYFGAPFELEEGLGSYEPPRRGTRIQDRPRRTRLDRAFERGLTNRIKERGW